MLVVHALIEEKVKHANVSFDCSFVVGETKKKQVIITQWIHGNAFNLNCWKSKSSKKENFAFLQQSKIDMLKNYHFMYIV